MQLRFATNLTSEQYVSEKAWRGASLARCPLHSEGGCGFKRNGTYKRTEPPGVRVPRWYCPDGQTSFSLLPDCLAAKLPGSLAELEQVVTELEQAPSVETAADQLRPDIELPGRLRWVRRRASLVHAALVALIGLLPELLSGCEPTLGSVGAGLDSELGSVLPAVRAVAEAQLQAQLQALPPPLGFGSRSVQQVPGSGRRRQHDSGPRAPPASC